MCGFIEESKWHSQQAPGHKYVNKNYKIPDSKPKAAMMWKENEKTTDKRIERITKDKSKPAPGEYDDPKAWK